MAGKVCGARTRSGGRCKQRGLANGRCRWHGGKSTGPPLKHGRHSHYARILGSRFAELLTDPELLRSHEELALFDTFMTEQAGRIGVGISAGWVKELAKVTEALRLSVFVTPDPASAKSNFDNLRALVSGAADHLGAWQDLLTAARARSEIATKAVTAAARQDQAITERDMVTLFVRMLDVIQKEIGADAARRIGSRFEIEVLGERPHGLPPGA